MVPRVRTVHYYTHIDTHLFIHALMCVSTGSSVGKEPTCSEGDLGSIAGLGRSPGEGNGNPLQDCCLGNLWIEEPGRLYSPWGCKRVRYNLATK